MRLIKMVGDKTWAAWVKDGDMVFALISLFAEKDTAKAAGFRWHPDHRVWWTSNLDCAANLAEYATDSELRDSLMAVRETKKRSLDASRAENSSFEVPHPDGMAYLPFQIAGIEYICSRPEMSPNVLLGDEMGLGKTIQAIGYLNSQECVNSVLVVCPNTLKLNWRNELKKWLVNEYEIIVADAKCFPDTAGKKAVVIVNYEAIRKHGATAASVNWDVLIADESHRVKNPKSQQSKAVMGIKAKKIIAITGTPILNRIDELFPILQWLDPVRWKGRWMWYVKRYCNAVQTRYGWDTTGANKENFEELQTKLRETIMIRREKSKVLKELPAKTRQIVEVEAVGGAVKAVRLEREAYKKHRKNIDNARAEVELLKVTSVDEYSDAVARLEAARKAEFAEMAKIRKEVAVSKVPAVIAHVESVLESENKVVIFVHHHDVANALKAHFVDAVIVTGEIGVDDRQAGVDRFQNDDNCRIAIVSIMAGGVGITLTAARVGVFAEIDWVPAMVSQAEDRLHRIGQQDNVLIQHVLLSGSIDVDMARAIIAKQEIIDGVLDKIVAPSHDVEEKPATFDATVYSVAAEALTIDGERIFEIHECLRMLAVSDSDRATYKNGVGFNGVDSIIGHSLANCSNLSARQAVLGRKILKKYRKQLPENKYAKIFAHE